ncbi:MAG TPA: transglycosylase domain-containing protein [Acidimicrobiales bacterium]|nr:transglycosylase domain-containing protein [Acidimicrobiales bacterium]
MGVVRLVMRSMWFTGVAVIGVPVVAGMTIFAGLVFLPLPASIPVPKASPVVLPTLIYDRSGNEIASLRQFDQNIPVAESQIPPVLKEAVVADEDRNFYKEGGINLRGIVRAALADLRHGRVVQGGSTITQQYVKLAFTNGRRTIFRKLREAILASQLNRQASKDQILYHYLTLVYFGDGNYGVGAAAESYFRLPVQDLNASEAATLAGLIPAPSARAPRQDLAAAEQYRELVLGKMRQQGYLTAAAYRDAMASRLALSGNGPVPKGATVVYPPQVTPTRYPAFVQYVTAWLLQRFPPSEVYGGGLRVQTTLDPAIQADATAAVASTMDGTSDPLEMALAAVEPETGYVEAMVGGRADDYNGLYQQYDNLALGGCDYAGDRAVEAQAVVKAACWTQPTVTGGGSGRQPGSSWKPFVLAAAMEQGISPDTVFPAPGVLPIPGCTPSPQQGCVIHNDEGQGTGYATLRFAMAASINTVYAQLAERVGCPAVATMARTLGITSAFYDPGVQPFCAPYALGEVDVAPLDMASAYGVFADHGVRMAPTPVLEVVDASGRVLYDDLHPGAGPQVIPANVANNVTSVLQGVFGAGGTAAGLGLGRPAAGKTGTTDNYTNAWFVGYTPTLAAAVWLGNAQSQAATIDFCKVQDGYRSCNDQVFGATYSAPTWRAFMTAAVAKVPVTQFGQPAPIVPPAGVLQTTTTTAPPSIQPGYPSATAYVPASGPPTVPAPPPVAPPAPTSTVAPGPRGSSPPAP